MTAPRLESIQVSLPKEIEASHAPDPAGNSWTTGFFKEIVAGPVWLGRFNLVGDGQADRRNHGGADKAVLVYTALHYAAWREELRVPNLPYGAFGENFTVSGLDEGSVCVGDRYAIGAAQVEVSQPRQPCWKIAARWQMTDLTARVEASGRTGWYVRVLAEGAVEANDEVLLLDRPNPDWTVSRAASVMRHQQDRNDAAALAAVPGLSDAWRERLLRVAARGT